MNATGVMPVIFSSSLLAVPTALSRYFPQVTPTPPSLGLPPAALHWPFLSLLVSTGRSFQDTFLLSVIRGHFGGAQI